MTDYTHIPNNTDIDKDGIPKNTVPIILRLCADARSVDCPYTVEIKVDTEFVNFKQIFCGYMYKKK
jgi:hypothetical protein